MDTPIALTVAGSDSSGGAGIQADLRTFARLKVYGLSVVTAVTAQNTSGLLGVFDVPAEFVSRQLEAVLTEGGAAHTVTAKIPQRELFRLVEDLL